MYVLMRFFFAFFLIFTDFPNSLDINVFDMAKYEIWAAYNLSKPVLGGYLILLICSDSSFFKFNLL
jgi:hypothetical protein